MRNILDFTSWHTLLTTAIGLLLASLLMVGIRLVLMQTLQRRREREKAAQDMRNGREPQPRYGDEYYW